jgi:hypothetical protein
MARSARLRALESRLAELRRHMLPRAFDPTGSYTDREFDRARGYRLLAHAEIEACLEDLATSVINDAFKAWGLDRRPRQCLIAVLAYYEGKQPAVPEQISAVGASPMPLRARLEQARNAYVNWVRNDNHGVREHNVLRLLLPVGVLESDLDAAWLQAIDGFGSARGDTAHQALRTQQPPDPKSELQTVAAIVLGLRKLDVILSGLR